MHSSLKHRGSSSEIFIFIKETAEQHVVDHVAKTLLKIKPRGCLADRNKTQLEKSKLVTISYFIASTW
jgi:hypothetical protein